MVREYQTIVARDLNELDDLVNRMLAGGWRPQGGPFTMQFPHGLGIVQALVREDTVAAAPPMDQKPEPKKRDVEWIVSSIGELGVRVGDRLYFLYKDSVPLEYTRDDESEPAMHGHIQWRPIFKREFGETVWPESLRAAGRNDGKYLVGDGWQPIPMRVEEP